jgi:formylglycine-generating enzyme required for sulfatase activity
VPAVFRCLIAAILAVCAAAGLPTFAAAREPRVALVIANGAYANFDRLDATRIDGERIAGALSATGFVDLSGAGPVQVNRDLTLAQMQAKVAELRDRLKAAGPDALGVLYFSGHGAALASYGDLMLLPVDAAQQLSPANTELTRAHLTRTLLGSGAKNILLVLDMCRNVLDAPPPAASDAGTAPAGDAIGELPGTKGLRRIARQPEWAARPDQGYLVAFSTSADQVAFDDGTFSRVLAEEIRRPQQSVADALKRTSDRVALNAMKAGKNFQKPTFDYGLQGTPPCFVSCDAGGQDRFYDCANCPYMRMVPSGTALIGSPPGEPGRGRDEPVQHPVPIDRPFAMGVYEVTLSEWAACVQDKACRPIADWSKENPNPLIPATGISFEDAQAFVAWLSVQSGKSYRLPSEVEWEYAARAGGTDAFAWGPAIGPSDANYDQTASYRGSPTAPYRGYPEAVNAYPPNAFGLYQMSGNVWEWTQGCADQQCRARVARGGSFESTPGELRVANRFAIAGGHKRDDLGIRVARDLAADEAVH